MADLNCIIGSITLGFVKTEHLLSVIGFHFNFYDDQFKFLAQSFTAAKLKLIKEKFATSNIQDYHEYVALIERFDTLRLRRNEMVHGLISTNIFDSSHHMIHHYSEKKGEVKLKVGEFKTADLKAVESEIREVHNALYKLYFGNKS